MTAAVVLAFGGATTGALAQEPETPSSSAEPTPTSEPATPAPTTEPTPSSDPAPPSPTPSSEPPAPTTEPSPSSDTPVPPAQPDTKPERKAELKPEVRSQGPRPDLSVRVDFSKDEYLPGEDLTITVKVRNSGQVAADGVRFSLDRSDLSFKSGYEDLISRPSIAAGEERVITLGAQPSYESASSASITIRATVDGVADPTPGDNAASDNANIRMDRGTASGVLYIDQNGNGAPDAGEGLTSHWVIVEGGLPRTYRSAQVDGQGQFSFADLPTGSYRIVQLVGNPNRYAVKPGTSNFSVEKGKNTTLDVAAVKMASDLLTAQLTFDRDSYAKTDKVGITITLTNKSTAPMTGVVAVCNPDGDRPGNVDWTSEGWKALDPDGPGTSLAAGETKVIQISEIVPADTTDTISLGCNFGNDGRNTFGYVGGSDYAKVLGLNGRARGSVVNAETGQPIGRSAVFVLDPDTRKVIGSAELFPTGVWETYNVRAGKVVFLVPGPWKPKDGVEFTAEIKADETIALPPFEVVPGPNVPDPSRVAPDVAVTATFDKDDYDVADLVQVTVKVENKGTAAGYVRLADDYPAPQNQLTYDRRQWGDFANYMKQILLQPGESRVLKMTGTIPWFATTSMVFQARMEVYGDSDLSNNKVVASAGVRAVTGNAEVLAYGDKNGNGKYDTGEEFADVEVTVGGGNSGAYLPKRTDASGKALFTDLRIASYYVFSEFRDGWVMEGSSSLNFTISANATTAVELKGRRPLSDKLSASVNFVKDSYAVGEQYELDITLTNRTGGDLPAVKAFCSGPGEPGEIGNIGPGWHALAWDGAGVALKDGETRTWRVSGDQPSESPRIGYATISCGFGPDPGERGVPLAHDAFRVPGEHSDALGQLLLDDPNSGEDPPAPNMTVVLVDNLSKKVVTRTITDEQGRFKVFNLPVGRYDLIVPGPWKVEYYRMNPYFQVRVGDENWEQVMYLVPGPEVEDPGYQLPEDEVPGTNVPPAEAGGGGGADGDALAKTGASVLGLGLVGALLVAFGFGAAAIGRRRVA